MARARRALVSRNVCSRRSLEARGNQARHARRVDDALVGHPVRGSPSVLIDGGTASQSAQTSSVHGRVELHICLVKTLEGVTELLSRDLLLTFDVSDRRT